MTATTPLFSITGSIIEYIGTSGSSFEWKDSSGNSLGSTSSLDTSQLLVGDYELYVDAATSPLTIGIRDESSSTILTDGSLDLSAETAQYLVWNSATQESGFAQSSLSGFDSTNLVVTGDETLQFLSGGTEIGGLVENVGGFNQVYDGTKSVFLAGFDAVAAQQDFFWLKTDVYAPNDGNTIFDVTGTPFTTDVLDVVVATLPTSEATITGGVDFFDASNVKVATYTTALDQTDIDEGFTGKVVVYDGSTSNIVTKEYYLTGVENISFDVSGGTTPYPYEVPAPTGPAPGSTNSAPTGDVVITGTVADGATLTVDTSNLVDADGIDPATITYQWQVDTIDVTGANSATYTVKAADVGKSITVQFSYTDNGGTDETVTSQPASNGGGDSVPTPDLVIDSAGTYTLTAPDGDNYVKVADDIAGTVSVDGGTGFDVLEMGDAFTMADRVIRDPADDNSYILQVNKGYDGFLDIGKATNSGNGSFTFTRFDQPGSGSVSATFTISNFEMLKLINPDPNSDEGDDNLPLIAGNVSGGALRGTPWDDTLTATLADGLKVDGVEGFDTLSLGSGTSTVSSTSVTPATTTDPTYYNFTLDNGTAIAISRNPWLDQSSQPEEYFDLKVAITANSVTNTVSVKGIETLIVDGASINLHRILDDEYFAEIKQLDSNAEEHLGHPDDDWKDNSPTNQDAAEADLKLGDPTRTTDHTLFGHDDDFYFGSAGSEVRLTEELRGGHGNDRLIGRGGKNLLDGGDGYDEVSYEFAHAGVHVDLFKTSEQETGVSSDTLRHVENIRGSFDSDILGGNGRQNSVDADGGDDFVDGGRGHDNLMGGFGFDTLIGGLGNDVIEGGDDDDVLSGGIGADTFVFNVTGGGDVSHLGTDAITDFNSFADTIELVMDSNDGTAFLAALDAATDAAAKDNAINQYVKLTYDQTNDATMVTVDLGTTGAPQDNTLAYLEGIDLSLATASDFVMADILTAATV